MDEQQKDRIGDYELLDLIGDGAQGRVYKARRVVAAGEGEASGASEELVALKVVRITGEDEKARMKFQEQSDILRRLSHPSIVAYRDCFLWHAGDWDESQCLAMELLEGETLHDRLKKASSGLPWPQVEEIFEQCLAGLIHARERGITHRDLKPSNIFLTNDGRAKLIDFDIARRDDSSQVSTAGFKGTFDYMAPDFITIEGFRGDEISDVFSIGVCFYQALTGALPFERLGDTAHIGYLNRWRDNANPAPSFRPGVFRVLANAKTVVARCLTARRDQRYQSFAAMLEDFRKIRYRRVRHKDKDDYELLALMGRGGFGEVFKGRRASDGMLVAVKYLFAEKQSDRFIREAKILQQYSHPNLVRYVDFLVLTGATGEKQFFLIMEFLEGMPGWGLRHRIKNEGRLEVDEIIPLFSAYLSALQFLHENPKPIIHRDIKPGNLYAPAGQPEKGKIFDLGVARDVTGTVTVGGVPGTLDYMAPEFAEAGGDRGSPQSDLYALGLCLYEALTGKPAFDRLPTDFNSAWVTFQNRIRNPPLLDFDVAVFTQYPRFKQVVATALAMSPSDRYRSAADMRAALQATLDPAAIAQDTLDGLDDSVDVTMATFSPPGGQQPPLAAPGLPEFRDESAAGPVTTGTRPVATSGGQTMVGTASPPPPVRRGKRLVIGGIAALLLAGVGIGVGWFLSNRSERVGEPVALQLPSAAESAAVKPESAPKSAPVATPSPAPAPATPSPTPAPAAPVAKTPSPAPPVATPAPTPAPAAPVAKATRPVPLPEASDPLFIALRDSLPAKITSPADWSAAELSLARLEAQQAQPWPGLDEVGKQRRLDNLRGILAERAAAYLAQRGDAVIALYDAGQDGDSERDRLAAIIDQTPMLKPLVALHHTKILAKVDAARTAQSVRTTVAGLPTRIKQADSSANLQTLMTAFTKLEQTPGIKLQAESVKNIEEAFAARAMDFAKDLAKNAETAYTADQLKEGDVFQKQLKDMVAALPPRFGQATLTPLEQAVATARQNADSRIKEAAALAKAKQEMMNRLDGLAATLPARGTADVKTVMNLFNALAEIKPDDIKDKEAKGKIERIMRRCSESLSVLVAQNEPVETRSERLAAVEECLAAPAAALLGRQANALQEQLKKQQGLSVLRLTNKFTVPVTVSSVNTAFRRASLATDATRIWIMAVPSETLSLSVAIDLGDRNRSRFVTLKLPRGGGLSQVLGEDAGISVTPEPAATLPPTAPAIAQPSMPTPPAAKPSAPTPTVTPSPAQPTATPPATASPAPPATTPSSPASSTPPSVAKPQPPPAVTPTPAPTAAKPPVPAPAATAKPTPPATPAVATPSPAPVAAKPQPRPSTAAATPPPGSEAAAAASAATQAYLEISVIPREATVLVDGQPATGKVEVSAGENHQVNVSLKGYKTVEQYYRVKAGETRKVDLFLEKEERRSLFGF